MGRASGSYCKMTIAASVLLSSRLRHRSKLQTQLFFFRGLFNHAAGRYPRRHNEDRKDFDFGSIGRTGFDLNGHCRLGAWCTIAPFFIASTVLEPNKPIPSSPTWNADTYREVAPADRPLVEVDVLAARLKQDQAFYQMTRDQALAGYAKGNPPNAPYDAQAKEAIRLYAYLSVWVIFTARVCGRTKRTMLPWSPGWQQRSDLPALPGQVLDPRCPSRRHSGLRLSDLVQAAGVLHGD